MILTERNKSMANPRLSGWKDKILFTPGPLTTSKTVKMAMLRDLGSRDFTFVEMIKEVRRKLVALGGVDTTEYDTVLMQGSGTFGVESVITSAVPKDGKLLIIINGAYGERIRKMAQIHGIAFAELVYGEDALPVPADVEKVLAADTSITHVAVIHSETTSGLINPVTEIGAVVKKHNKVYIVDAMSSFGAVPVNLNQAGIDFIVSSSNKCIEGVPGFSFVIAKLDELKKIGPSTRSLSLDLYSQWKGLEESGQFRFTPPTHAIMAFHQALLELEEEGGIEARAARYKHNYEVLQAGMAELGFKEYVPRENQGYIITSFLYPEHKNFDFGEFYRRLNEKDQVIYPGKLSKADCFRIGNIGRLFEQDIYTLLAAIRSTLEEMKVTL